MTWAMAVAATGNQHAPFNSAHSTKPLGRPLPYSTKYVSRGIVIDIGSVRTQNEAYIMICKCNTYKKHHLEAMTEHVLKCNSLTLPLMHGSDEALDSDHEVVVAVQTQIECALTEFADVANASLAPSQGRR